MRTLFELDEFKLIDLVLMYFYIAIIIEHAFKLFYLEFW